MSEAKKDGGEEKAATTPKPIIPQDLGDFAIESAGSNPNSNPNNKIRYRESKGKNSGGINIGAGVGGIVQSELLGKRHQEGVEQRKYDDLLLGAVIGGIGGYAGSSLINKIAGKTGQNTPKSKKMDILLTEEELQNASQSPPITATPASEPEIKGQVEKPKYNQPEV